MGKKIVKSNKIGSALGAIGVVATVVGVLGNEEVQNLVVETVREGKDTFFKFANAKIDERGTYTEVPDAFNANHPLKLEEVRQWVRERELKGIEAIAKPSIDFAGLSDFDVVASSHKPKQKLRPGDRITIYYLTPEVIAESKQLLNEVEQLKQDELDRKAAKKEEGRQKRAAIGAGISSGFGAAVAKVGETTGNLVDSAGKGISGVAEKLGKRDNDGVLAESTLTPQFLPIPNEDEPSADTE